MIFWKKKKKKKRKEGKVRIKSLNFKESSLNFSDGKNEFKMFKTSDSSDHNLPSDLKPVNQAAWSERRTNCLFVIKNGRLSSRSISFNYNKLDLLLHNLYFWAWFIATYTFESRSGWLYGIHAQLGLISSDIFSYSTLSGDGRFQVYFLSGLNDLPIVFFAKLLAAGIGCQMALAVRI